MFAVVFLDIYMSCSCQEMFAEVFLGIYMSCSCQEIFAVVFLGEHDSKLRIANADGIIEWSRKGNNSIREWSRM